MQSSNKLYADDRKLYHSIRTPEDERQLQQDITALEAWSSRWLLRFHPEKCTMLRVGLREAPRNNYKIQNNDNPVTLIWKNEERDLGVQIDGKLNFQKEVDLRVKKANSLVGLIRCSFNYLTKQTFLQLYKAIVRPHLEYAVSVRISG